MSDHIDGPRQIGDPSADLTDLFAFTSPENPARTVLAACVFPTCGVDAVFSNAVNHSFVVRCAKVAGLGDATKFETSDPDIRFSVRFEALERAAADQKPFQRGSCILPDGQTLRFLVNDESGASTPDGIFRVFAGLRSDPFVAAWAAGPNTQRPVKNVLDQDNVLCLVVEFDTRRVLAPEQGSLFGVIAETTPLPRPGPSIGFPPPRLDWVGRPEHTNFRLDNAGLTGAADLRDLWNQQTPFAIAPELRPVFLKRLTDSLANWDMRDGKADWTPSGLAANANMFLDDFLLFDVAKPITDTSHLEIEKSTLNGKPYETGGGRTMDALVVDIMLTWQINHDRQPLQGGASKATKPGTSKFPYFASPNTELQSVTQSIALNAAPEKVWALIGKFDASWHPAIANIKQTGTGIGALRFIETVEGKYLIERLEETDDRRRFYRYSLVSGLPASDYTGVLEVKPNGAGSTVEWRAQFLGSGQGTIIVRAIVSTLFKTGLESLKARF